MAGNWVVLLPLDFLTGNPFFFLVPRTGAGFPGSLATPVGFLHLLNGFRIVATAVFLAFSIEANAAPFVMLQPGFGIRLARTSRLVASLTLHFSACTALMVSFLSISWSGYAVSG